MSIGAAGILRCKKMFIEATAAPCQALSLLTWSGWAPHPDRMAIQQSRYLKGTDVSPETPKSFNSAENCTTED
jgi:hypothetical protein